MRQALAGEVRAADVAGMTESEHESEDSAEEGGRGRDNADPEAEARVAEAVRLEEEGRKRRAAPRPLHRLASGVQHTPSRRRPRPAPTPRSHDQDSR